VLEAVSRAREGEQEAALALLDEADRAGAGLAMAARLEAALARAAVYSLSGRFQEERETYERWRPLVLEARDDLLTARLLSHEALGLADRREFAQAIARLEEALAAARDDAAERARLSIDLASTLYHAGRAGRSRELLDEAAAIAGSIGRQDLARIARANRLELMINGGEWAAAFEEIESLAALARAEGDETWLLVALHHRSRLSLRRGLLDEAARDNAEARALAGKLSDRLEVGELWLEEGDRLVYEGDLAAARRAYESAALDPPDRCDSETKARQRLAELDRACGDGLAASACKALAAFFERDEYEAAETAARWQILLRGQSAQLPPDLSNRAQRVLRSSGGAALADRAFGEEDRAGSLAVSSEAAFRRLRAAVAGSLAGERLEAPLGELGLDGLRVADAGGRELVCFGRVGEDAARYRLDAGTASYELALSPPAGSRTSSVALLLETLLFRLPPAVPPSDFADGWRRLGVIAADASMEEPYRRLLRFGPQPVTVLVLGESGCGKEAVARAVHALSPRASAPFVAVNVPAIPPALLESELFGHARGAFTGADRDRKGLLEEAERGTIFFDEVGDLTLPLQAKLLRALQEREIRRVGENRARRLDVRVVSATSRNLEREVEAGRFREDLYYRLHVAVIALPPLRERGRDSQLLARHFLSHYAREYGRVNVSFAPETLAALCAHCWPGNVRELQNVVAQAAALAESGATISPALLPETLRRPKHPVESRETYRTRVDQHRRSLIVDALERAGGNRSRAARDLGLSRQALLYLIRELNVASRPRSGRPA
jgi:transcriptional regulator with AAA-type ATPase domain